MSEHISKAELDALDALEQKATKGLWRRSNLDEWCEFHHNHIFSGAEKDLLKSIAMLDGVPMNARLSEIKNDKRWQEGLANGAFISSSRNAHPRTSATLREAMEALEYCLAMLDAPAPVGTCIGCGQPFPSHTAICKAERVRHLLESWNGEAKL